MSFFEIPIPEFALEYRVSEQIKLNMDFRKWSYMEHADSDNAGGPYDTEDEAIAAAIESLEGDSDIGWREVMIGRCKFVDPVDVVTSVIDLDELVERMNEYAYDNCFSYDDDFFDINDHGEKHGAKNALKEIHARSARAPGKSSRMFMTKTVISWIATTYHAQNVRRRAIYRKPMQRYSNAKYGISSTKEPRRRSNDI